MNTSPLRTVPVNRPRPSPDREALDRKLSDSLPAFEKVEKTFAMLEASSPELQGWHAGLPATSKRITEGAVELHRWHREVSSWKPEPLGEAEASHRKTNAALEAAQARWTELRERQATLKSQSEQISGGVCPFLKETCQQFDPGKVEADLSAMTQEIEQGKQLSEARKKDHQVAGEVLDKLKRQEAQLRPRQESLESGGRDIMRELDTLLPKRVRDGAANLRAWDERIHELPVPPPVPEVFKPEDVDDIAAAVNAFVNKAQAWWHALEQVMKERNAHQVKARTERAREEQSLVQLKQRNEELATETRRLSEEAQAKRSEAGKRTGEAAASQKKVTEYDHQLKPHASLEDSLKAQREGLETHREAHEKHLQSRECAASLEERKQALASAASKLEEADLRLKDETRQWTEADKAFDQEALDKAIAHYESRRDAVATMDNNLVHARKAKDEEEQRFKAWEQACRELDGIKAQMDRLETSIEITDLARKVLKDAAPAVAQHLCNRIAGRAKTVFNQINPDPIDLQWEAKQYSVRIVPDDRRFAMLSGGEQTKLALALTLAMIEEFGGLRFCIFDEPTYGVDADSRQKLADAIIAMQSAAHLEQLLLVSHDDAFDGKIEHAILLKKSAGSGSAVNLGA
jgi:exonuclease SbcC